jgi:hypothetical protein
VIVPATAVFDEELRAAAAEFARVFKENVGFAGVHFLEDDDVVGINLGSGQYMLLGPGRV